MQSFEFGPNLLEDEKKMLIPVTVKMRYLYYLKIWIF